MPIALITGGHTGIGYSCARHLASHFKWDLLLAGRSPARMKEAAAELRRDFGIEVTCVDLDTSSLASVRKAAAHVTGLMDNGEIGRLDALLCNAGGRFDGPVAFSEDGYEVTFATNCLGHFLLVDLLKDCIADNGRVLFTASGTHDPDTADGRMVGAAVEPDATVLAGIGKDGNAPISAGKRYTTSKLCNVLNAYELHRRLRASGRPVSSIAFDPGLVSGTGFLRGMPMAVQWLSRTAFLNWVFRRRGITMGSLDFSGASLARLAADPEFADASGKYFQSKDGKLLETRSSTLSYDETRAARLWNQMDELAGLHRKENEISTRRQAKS
ncbi:SDR family NAD(P)-dependent oxidoreductase [Celeribacter indicus]|uniref:Glucose/ribitol short chain dehydrogenase/reductase family protein n=1 Tax=Celeribacter indicus TaxID=1208324 RepID=A0A0B5E0R5_9RHOB|nr:SDR family NAD(P)-dependent oxidoreductase [Celeribacter indicus]AJE47015.1 glucose/ribitol short chain dehydrogenase/reductase family protein [Celeribacter indicus]SDW92849.1 short chain dehydrogenase [Celeribacter indicus]